jgi:hypothetical protein
MKGCPFRAAFFFAHFPLFGIGCAYAGLILSGIVPEIIKFVKWGIVLNAGKACGNIFSSGTA